MEQQPSGPEQPMKMAVDPAELLQESTRVEISESKLKLEGGEEMGLLEARPEFPQDIPTIVAPGILETPHALQDFAQGLAEHGERDTLVVAQPRQGRHERASATELAGYAQTYVDRGERLVQTMLEKDYKQVDLVAHSQGCIDAVVAALMAQESNPGLIRNLVLVNPAGAVEADPGAVHGALKAAGKTARSMLHDAKSAVLHPTKLSEVARVMRGATEYIKPDPMRTATEVVALLQTDIRAGLRQLKELGVGVSIVAGVDDRLFPMGEYQKSISTDEVDGFYSVQGGHNEVLLEADQQAAAISGILNSMAVLAEKRERNSYGLAG